MNFYNDMGDIPDGMTLERKDNNKGYYKDNCKWATPMEQANNRSSNVVIEFDGIRKTISEWGRFLRIAPRYMQSFKTRLTRNRNLAKAACTPALNSGTDIQRFN